MTPVTASPQHYLPAGEACFRRRAICRPFAPFKRRAHAAERAKITAATPSPADTSRPRSSMRRRSAAQRPDAGR